MKMGLFLLFLVPCVCAGDCLPVSGDRIFGRDLALVDVRFAELPESMVLGSAPLPGTKRVFAAAELVRLGRAHGIALVEPVEICFEIPLKKLDEAEALCEMQRLLPSAGLVIVELSKATVPAGRLEFPLAGLEPASVAEPAVQLWHGFVRYSETRRVPVWARVRIAETITAVVADRAIPANSVIDAALLRIESRTGTMKVRNVALRVEDVTGRVATRPVAAGAFIPLGELAMAPDVHRGDAVQVQVVCGTARLQLSAIAQQDGRNGELIQMRNPSTGKTFLAKVDGSKALLVVGSGSGL